MSHLVMEKQIPAHMQQDDGSKSTNSRTGSPVSRPKSAVEKVTGFQHTYNAILWFGFGGALFWFAVSRLPLLDFHYLKRHGGIGEYYYFNMNLYRGGFIAHLIGILFANILAVFQFVPIIRHRMIILHRINGYTIFVLYLLGAAGGIVITPHAYGGHIDTQTAAGALAILVLIAWAIAYIQIKRLQIDQHRKWMLRGISMMASIVTSRIILLIATKIMSDIGTYHEMWPCKQLQYVVNDQSRFSSAYPECANLSGHAVVLANASTPEGKGSCSRLVFGMCLWLAVSVHIILMEFYIHFTPFESERLRRVSYERQLERGFKHPGSAGITSDLLSRMKWAPPATA